MLWQNVHLRYSNNSHLSTVPWTSALFLFFFYMSAWTGRHTHAQTFFLFSSSLFRQFIRIMRGQTRHELHVVSVLLVCDKEWPVSSQAMEYEYDCEWIIAFQCIWERSCICVCAYVCHVHCFKSFGVCFFSFLELQIPDCITQSQVSF